MNDKRARCLLFSLLGILLFTALVRIPLLNIPLERDEGEYAYIAWRMGHHELPYRDWVDQKPPGIFWAYRLALLLPVNSIASIHLLGLLVAAASACALFILALRFTNWFWSLMAALLLVLLSAGPSVDGQSANTELFMLLPLILSLLTFFRSVESDRRKTAFVILTGILTGLAMLFKQVAAVNCFFLVAAFPLFVAREKRFRNTLLFAAWSLAGVMMVWVLVGAYFAWRDSWHEFVYNVFTHNLEYVHATTSKERLHYFSTTIAGLLHDEIVVWGFSIVGFGALLKARRFKVFGFFVLWLATSWMGVSASGYYFPHYFQQLLPVLCLAAVIGAEAIEGGLKEIATPARRAALTSLLVVLPAATLFPFLFIYSPAEAITKIYPGNHFAQSPGLAARIDEVTSPTNTVFIFGAEPEVLFYAHRVSATRYIFLFPLYGPYSDARAKQMATADEITRNRPKAILWMPNMLFFQPGSDQYFTDWAKNYLATHFYVDTFIGYFQPDAIQIITDVPDKNRATLSGFQVFGEIDVRKGSNGSNPGESYFYKPAQ